MIDPLKIAGVSRSLTSLVGVHDEDRVLLVSFNRAPSDDELREFKEFVLEGFDAFDWAALQRLRKASA